MFTTDNIIKTSTKVEDNIYKRLRPRALSDSPKVYQNISVVKKLSTGKFPIYLTSSKINNQKYAMKVFSQVGEDSHDCYKNEIRFSILKHPNVIDMVHYENQKETIHRGERKKVSYILMEYAPYGDFFDFVTKHNDKIDEKLARTYFRQFIDGVEYLHENAVAHLDLKPENLLLGADFNLKIADFDLSHVYGDDRILSRGTRYYRAPEFFKVGSSSSSPFELEDTFAADIYSAGVFLFILKSGGMYPHAEDHILDGLNFAELMYKNNLKFWMKHCEIQNKDRSFYSREFKELFNNMVKENPAERMTIRQIKASKWYNGPIYTPQELKDKMKNILQC